MPRKYRLRDYDEPWDDPNAAWRDDPATIRQYRRLDFFKVRHRRNLTKGQAAELIDGIEPSVEQLEDYEEWKSAGEPSIKQWHGRQRRSFKLQREKTGCCGLIVGAFCILILIGVTFRVLFPSPEALTPPPASSPQPATAPHVAAVGGVQPTPSAAPQPQLTEREAQAAAIAKHPELGVARSQMNLEFLRLHRERRASAPSFFDTPEWPITLADEASANLRSSQ